MVHYGKKGNYVSLLRRYVHQHVGRKYAEAAASDNIDVDIFATASSGIDDAMEEQNPDVLMLGPQVRFMEKDLKGRLDIPVEVIDIRDYGTMNGEKVLQTALGLINQA